jgi:chemotaxis protein MotB
MARRGKQRLEEHQNHEAWAIPYADLLTLLLAFFVVMYAISSINEGKYRVLSDSLVAAFRGSPRTMKPVQVGEKQVGSGADIEITIVQQAMLEGQPRSIMEAPPLDHPIAQAEFRRMAEEVETALAHLVDANLIAVRRQALWVEVEIRTDILFPSGSAALSPGALPILTQVAETLRHLPNPIRVEGHTDNVPIRGGQWPSNWELSAARAASVVHLFTEQGLEPKRLSVIAFGEHRPVQSNATAEGRNANRRVLIVILGGDGPPVSEVMEPDGTRSMPAAAPEGAPLPAPAAVPATSEIVPLPAGTEPAAPPAATSAGDGNPTPPQV